MFAGELQRDKVLRERGMKKRRAGSVFWWCRAAPRGQAGDNLATFCYNGRSALASVGQYEVTFLGCDSRRGWDPLIVNGCGGHTSCLSGKEQCSSAKRKVQELQTKEGDVKGKG